MKIRDKSIIAILGHAAASIIYISSPVYFLTKGSIHKSNDMYAGAGIGFAVCKRTAERCGGSHGINARESWGTIFHFIISKKEA